MAQLLKSDVKCKAFSNIYSTRVLHNLASIYLEVDAILVKKEPLVFVSCGNSKLYIGFDLCFRNS